MTPSCPQCSDDIQTRQLKLTCISCHATWHTECAMGPGITSAANDKVKQWTCYVCFIPSEHIKDVMRQQRPDNSVDEVMSKLDQIQNEHKELAPRIEQSVKNAIRDKFNENWQQHVTQWSDLIKKPLQDTTKAIAENNVTVIREAVQESKERMDSDGIEREKRKCNLIVRDVEESEGSRRDIYDFDREKAETILDIGYCDIVTAYRVGKRSREPDGKPRPLIITVITPELAKELHNHGRGQKRRIRGAEYWINEDLIQADRVANFRARKLAEERKLAAEQRSHNARNRRNPQGGTPRHNAQQRRPENQNRAPRRSPRRRSHQRRREDQNRGASPAQGRAHQPRQERHQTLESPVRSPERRDSTASPVSGEDTENDDMSVHSQPPPEQVRFGSPEHYRQDTIIDIEPDLYRIEDMSRDISFVPQPPLPRPFDHAPPARPLFRQTTMVKV